MPYPSSKTTFTDPAGTSAVDTVPTGGHAQLHTDLNDTIEALEDTLGTTAGTNLTMHFAAGQFPVRHTGNASTGTLQQTLVGGTLANNTVGTPTFTFGGDAAGDLFYRSSGGTATRLGAGTIGAFLRSGGAGAAPTWATGNIIQVVSTTYSTVGSVAGTTHTDSGLAGTITPIGTGSKFLIMANIETLTTAGTTGMSIFLVRDTTTVYTPAVNHGQIETAITNFRDFISFSYVDSPATLAATTYKVQYNRNAGIGTVYVQSDGATSSITILEIAQ